MGHPPPLVYEQWSCSDDSIEILELRSDVELDSHVSQKTRDMGHPASRSSQPPDKRGDVLVCGSDTELAWNLGWLRPDLRNKIYENARLLKVRFRSSGHSSRNKGTWWICKRNDEEIICD
jgi:hypothetical protein